MVSTDLESQVPLKKQRGSWHLVSEPRGIQVISSYPMDLESMELGSDLTPSCFLILGQSPLITFKWECQHHFTGLLREIKFYGKYLASKSITKKNKPNSLPPSPPCQTILRDSSLRLLINNSLQPDNTKGTHKIQFLLYNCDLFLSLILC